jgi:hypothetical protein
LRTPALFASLDADTLSHLAYLAREQQRPKAIDPALAARELAAMVERRTRPTIGWYRRRFIFPRANQAPRPPSLEAITRATTGMVGGPWPLEVVAETMVTVAIEEGVSETDAIEAVALGIAQQGVPARAAA